MSKNNILPLVLISFVLFYSCADDIVESTPSVGNPNVGTANFTSIQSQVLNVSCAVSGCHDGSQSPNLNRGVAYNNIVGKASSTGQNFIEPGDANSSYLFRKITGAAGISGQRMPRGRAALAQSVIDSIAVWINNGALNN